MPFIPDPNQPRLKSNFTPDQTQGGFVPDEVQPQQPSFLQGLGSNIANFGIGAGKGALSTLQGASTLGQNILGGTVGRLFGQKPEIAQIPQRFTQPQGTAQNLGFGAEQVGEFALPFGMESKATKGIETGFKTLKGLTGLAKKSVLEGITGGGITALQTGGDTKSTVDSTIISSLFPVGGRLLGAAKGLLPSGKDVGARVINSLIKPLLKDLSYGKNPGRAVAEEGITGRTLDELASNITKRKNEIGKQIRNIYESMKKNVNLSNLFNHIEEAITSANKTPVTNSSLISRLEGIKTDITMNIKGKDIGNLPAQEAFDLKQIISGITKFTGSVSDDNTVNSALKRTYGFIKEEVNKLEPKLIPLNEKFADLSSAEIATNYRDKIAQRSDLIKFAPKLAIGGGVIAAMASGNPYVALVGLGEAALQKGFESPIVMTNFAKLLAKSNMNQIQQLSKASPFLKGIILKNISNPEKATQEQQSQ